MEYIALNNGNKCPVIGIGTFMISPLTPKPACAKRSKWGMSV